MNAPLLQAQGLTKTFSAAPGLPETPVLSGVDLSLSAGESLAILGASGSGKSTLLNIIGTLDRPDAGTLVLAGQDLTSLGENDLALVRSRSVGLVFQLHHLLPQCTVLENVLVPTLVSNRRTPREAEERARRLLERVGLSHRLSHQPAQLSGGERQRVAVVRALINSPVLLLADEPTGSLDRRAAEELGDLLLELNREENVSLIVVTHSPALAARMGRVEELVDGRLVPREAR